MRTILGFSTVFVLCCSAGGAETPTEEIDFLLRHIKESNARFIRSGKEYSAEEGVDHMQKKLSRAGARVRTAETFITGVATKSYLTGEPYKVKLTTGKIVETGPWLTEALAAHRQNLKRP